MVFKIPGNLCPCASFSVLYGMAGVRAGEAIVFCKAISALCNGTLRKAVGTTPLGPCWGALCYDSCGTVVSLGLTLRCTLLYARRTASLLSTKQQLKLRRIRINGINNTDVTSGARSTALSIDNTTWFQSNGLTHASTIYGDT